jgi:putative peptide zinc metalloprotease protein
MSESNAFSMRLRLAGGIETLMSAGNVPLLYAPQSRKYFRLSSLAAEVIGIFRIQPSITAESIAHALSARHPQLQDRITRELNLFLDDLLQIGVVVSEGDMPRHRETGSIPSRTKLLLIRRALWRPERPILQPMMEWVRGRAILFTATLVALISILAIIAVVFFNTKAGASLDNPQWFAVMGLLTLHMVIHEICHVLASSYYGVRIRELGIGLLYLFVPVAYTDLTDGYRLQSSLQRACIALAGPAFDIAAAGLSALAGFSATGATSATLNTLFYSQIFLFLANINPLLPSDGYHVMEVLTGHLNFRRRGFTLLLRRVTFRPLPPHLRNLTVKQEFIYCLYASVSVLFTSYLFLMFLKFAWVTFFAFKG